MIEGSDITTEIPEGTSEPSMVVTEGSIPVFEIWDRADEHPLASIEHAIK
ncbi:MAG TPA: hypothetical protein VGF13_00890 [Verrucomicrobiae bacterium]